jgi:predicted transcriptional regulator/DNA-binding XRE family transcriptional regulator
MANAKKTNIMGRRVRLVRRQNGLNQVQLSEKLGISASYLNLIEHDQRPLTAALLVKLAQLFKLDVGSFAEDEGARIGKDLEEVFLDPLFEEHALTTHDLAELAGQPGAARAVLTLYHAYQSSKETVEALAARISEHAQLPGTDLAGLPSEEVSDLLQKSRNYFPALEAAAERLIREARLDPDDLYGSMVRHLSDALGIEVAIATVEGGATPLRRYEPATKRLVLSEALAPRSRNFNVAQQIGLLTLSREFQEILDAEHLTTPDSVVLSRIALSNYFAGAVLMPYEPFRAAAEAARYDIELLGHRFRTSFEQVCHRLTTLQRPGASGVPFHFVRVDIAGNTSKRFSASGIRFARFSGSCPRWNVHKSFMSPGSIRTQLSEMPDGSRYFCIARTIRARRGGYGSGHTLLAVGLGCEIAHARRLVYADGVDVANQDALVPIGTSCRLCERANCEQRAFPPVQQRLSIDENVRAVSFYAPAPPR